MIWEPFVLALFLGLIVSAGLYFAYLWPSVEPSDEEPGVAGADSRGTTRAMSGLVVDEPPSAHKAEKAAAKADDKVEKSETKADETTDSKAETPQPKTDDKATDDNAGKSSEES